MLHCTSDILYIVYGSITQDIILVYSMSLPAICNLAIMILWIIYHKESNTDKRTSDNDENILMHATDHDV